MPVLILTARGSWHEKVEGIDAGADDYLAKPFQMEELLARLRALIRRDRGHARAVPERGPRSTLDMRAARVSVDGAPVQLTRARIPPARLSDASPGPGRAAPAS